MKKMHSLTSLAAIGGLALFVTPSAQSQNQRFYVTGGIGPAFTEDVSLREFNGPVPAGTKVKFDTGVQFRVAFGYQINPWLATELESGVSYNEIRSITGALEADASMTHVPILVNLVVQSPKRSRWTPYLGVGVGGSSSIIEAHDIVLPTGPNTFTGVSGDQSDFVFAYHGFGGIRYHINDQMSVGLAYRYFGATESKWESDFGPGAVRFGDTHTHSVTASFTFSF